MNTWLKRHAVVAAVICFVVPSMFGDGSPASASKTVEGTGPLVVPFRSGQTFQVGEELEYRVTYSFFNIGTIKFKITDKVQRNGRTVYRAYAFMDSNPALSWLTELHIRFYGEFDDEAYSNWWISEDSSRYSVQYRRMFFDYSRKRMTYDRGRRFAGGERSAEFRDTVAISGYSQDGLSLFFFARDNVRQKKQVRIPTFVDNKEVSTLINFTNERVPQEIDVVKYPIETVRLDGRADFVGVYGMTGGFEGWFTNDDASIPVTARLKVFLGSIKVELTKWIRPGWQLPRYSE